MARTKASVGAKVAAGKSSKARCAAPTPSAIGSSGSSDRSSRSHSGGNSVCPRETPKWQRPITNFFVSKDMDNSKDSDSGVDDDTSGSNSRSKPKRNIIQSDDEDTGTNAKKDETADNKPKNTELDETIELEPLTGDDSHKIEEYFSKNGTKGKGIGKKSKEKENIDVNIRRNSKRDLEQITFGEEPEHERKKIKVSD